MFLPLEEEWLEWLAGVKSLCDYVECGKINMRLKLKIGVMWGGEWWEGGLAVVHACIGHGHDNFPVFLRVGLEIVRTE